MGIWKYLKQRWKAMAGGFVFGLAAGFARTYLFEPPHLTFSGRLILALQIAAAFAALSLFVMNYLELRQRVIQKARTGPPSA